MWSVSANNEKGDTMSVLDSEDMDLASAVWAVVAYVVIFSSSSSFVHTGTRLFTT